MFVISAVVDQVSVSTNESDVTLTIISKSTSLLPGTCFAIHGKI